MRSNVGSKWAYKLGPSADISVANADPGVDCVP
jgi:hypothetical protein